MKLTDSLINVALLGTSNRKLIDSEIPDFLRPHISELSENHEDYEDYFFKLTAISFSCENSGCSSVSLDDDSKIVGAIPETLSYIDRNKSNLLVFLAKQNFSIVLKYAFNYFKNQQLIIQPYALPYFINKAYNFNDKYVYQFSLSIWPLLGNRGKWLVENCNFASEKWENSSHAQHLKMFVAMRKQGLAASSKFLSNNWESESSAHKSDFLSVFGRVLDSDLDFLEKVFENDKSQKVKDLAFRLLQQNENSIVAKFYSETLNSIISFDGKKDFEFEPISNSEELQKFGISDDLNDGDEYPPFLTRLSTAEKIVYKLIHSVPFSFWKKLTTFSSKKLAAFLLECPAFKFGFNFKKTILRFRDSEWAFEYCKYYDIIFQEFMPVFSSRQLETLAEYCDFDKNFYISDKIFGNFDNFETWGEKFSLKVLIYIIKSRNFDNSPNCAQFLATKLSDYMNIFISDYLYDHKDNDIVTTFFKRISVFLSYMKQIKS